MNPHLSISEASLVELEQLQSQLHRRNSASSVAAHKAGSEVCRVCGDGNAKMHYGVLTCFGCKGFFRRTLKRPSEYSCRHSGQCVVDRHERNSCRYCRFRKCIEVGMDPKAVRPDRDATGRHYQGRARRNKGSTEEDGNEVDGEWSRKLPVDMRTTLMQLMNIELMVNSGDSSLDARQLYPLPLHSLTQLIEDPAVLDGKRTEIRFDAFREVASSELPAIAHRTLITMVDWVDHLCDIIEVQSLEDKITLVKNAFASLMVFNFAANTARNTKEQDIICLCNSGFVRRGCDKTMDEPYHLANRVVDRCLDDLVSPFRALHLNEEECVLIKAIIVLNHHARPLSAETAEAIADLRDRVQETLYHVVRETHPKEVTSSRFGNLLLFLPAITVLGNTVVENLLFVDSFGQLNDGLMRDVLADGDSADSHGMSADQILSALPDARPSPPHNGLNHSDSSSSIESLLSNPSTQPSASNGGEHNGMTYNYSSSSLPGAFTVGEMSLNQAASLPNLDQLPDSDPDYNLTLTPDMFSGMRQAMSMAHAMDTSGNMPGTIPQQSTTPPNSPHPMAEDRPHFFLPTGATASTTVECSRHKFTVTTTSNNYPLPCSSASSSHVPLPPQQLLCKSNSLPPQQFNPQQQQQLQQQQQHYFTPAPVQAQPMDYEDMDMFYA